MAESTTLLTWQGVKPFEGSNPSLSALKRNQNSREKIGRRKIKKKYNKKVSVLDPPDPFAHA